MGADGLRRADLRISRRARGIDITDKDACIQITRVPMVGITDAKDVCDRNPRHQIWQWIWHAEVTDVHSGQPSPDYVQVDGNLEHVCRRWNQGDWMRPLQADHRKRNLEHSAALTLCARCPRRPRRSWRRARRWRRLSFLARNRRWLTV